MALRMIWLRKHRFLNQVLEEFLEFIEGFVLVGHNIARFDMNFLYRDVEKYFERSLPNDYIDTLQMARRGASESGASQADGSGRILRDFGRRGTSGIK